jgi:hypothetical protein
MNTRESFNQQDTPVTTGEMAVRGRPSRSIVKALRVQPVRASVVSELVRQQHYLHSMPAAPRACFAVYLDAELVGAMVFTSGPRLGFRLVGGGYPQQAATLARLWLSDVLPANSESRVIGVVLRHLRRHTPWKILLSYADPMAGHVGTIYQATGWLYLGQTAPSSYLDLGDGRLQHPRSVSNRLGSNSVRHLRNTGIRASRQAQPGKFRYVYCLDPHWRWRLTAPVQPYPRSTHPD